MEKPKDPNSIPTVGGQPEGIEGMESAEYLRATFYFAEIIHTIDRGGITVAMPEIPTSIDAQRRANQEYWRPNDEKLSLPNQINVVDSYILKMGITVYDNSPKNYALDPKNPSPDKVKYIGVFTPWRITQGAEPKIEVCFHLEQLKECIDRQYHNEKERCLDLLNKIMELLSAESTRISAAIEQSAAVNRESLITKIRTELKAMAQAVKDAEVPSDVPQMRDLKYSFFRAQTPVYNMLKAMSGNGFLTNTEFMEFTDELTAIKDIARAKYPKAVIDAYEDAEKLKGQPK